MEELRNAIKTLINNNLIVTDGVIHLVWCNGEMSYSPGDSVPYVVHSIDNDDLYEEYEDLDEAIDSFIEYTGMNEE